MTPPGTSQKILPVATGRQVATHTRRVMARRWREFASVVGLYTAATAAGLIPPRMLGAIVSAVQHGTTVSRIDT